MADVVNVMCMTQVKIQMYLYRASSKQRVWTMGIGQDVLNHSLSKLFTCRRAVDRGAFISPNCSWQLTVPSTVNLSTSLSELPFRRKILIWRWHQSVHYSTGICSPRCCIYAVSFKHWLWQLVDPSMVQLAWALTQSELSVGFAYIYAKNNNNTTLHNTSDNRTVLHPPENYGNIPKMR